MNIEQHQSISFYRCLGKFFYAVAASDRTVNKKEFKVLKAQVKAHWLAVDDVMDDFDVDTASQIEFIFDWGMYKELDTAQEFKRFKEFYLGQNDLFTEPIKKMVLKTARAIAYAFAGINKSESVILNQLSALLESKD